MSARRTNQDTWTTSCSAHVLSDAQGLEASLGTGPGRRLAVWRCIWSSRFLVVGVIAAGLSPVFGTPGAKGADDESSLSIRATEAWSGVFGGRETDFHFAVFSAVKADIRGSWSMTAEDRVIARREITLAAGPGKPGTIAVRFELPAAREGIILPIDLTVNVQAGQEQASLEKRLWIFPDDPHALEREWLKSLKLTLFDPPGDTSRIFRDAKIPFDQARSADKVAALDDGMLVVGEGVSWTEQRRLPKILVDLAARGIPVLSLAPATGSLTLPGSDADDSPAPTSVLLRCDDIITELDKRLDAVAWPPDGSLQSAGLRLVAERGRVTARFVEGATGWPWLESQFSAPRGRLIVCGFSIVRQWEAGPTPRYLFARILKRLAADADQESARRKGSRQEGK